jgi:hypothetical protein
MENSIQPPVKNDSVAKNEMKLDAFRKQVEEEKARYLNSVKASRAMTLNNLQPSECVPCSNGILRSLRAGI